MPKYNSPKSPHHSSPHPGFIGHIPVYGPESPDQSRSKTANFASPDDKIKRMRHRADSLQGSALSYGATTSGGLMLLSNKKNPI